MYSFKGFPNAEQISEKGEKDDFGLKQEASVA